MVTSDWRNPVDVEKYRDFTEDMVAAVLRHEGTLKAEHGTGRVMAPFVERQWGAELYDVMKTVRKLGDPNGVLNPGTLLTDDSEGHMQHFKMMPPVDEWVDRCVECGYCEPTCPSADLTQTPRRRIALLRSAEELPEAQRKELMKDYQYEAIDTCAADSLCLLACPLRIDTGVFMKGFRAKRHMGVSKAAMNAAAKNWGPIVSVLRVALNVADKVPNPVLTGVTKGLRTVISKDIMYQVGNDLPAGGPKRPKPQSTSARKKPRRNGVRGLGALQLESVSVTYAGARSSLWSKPPAVCGSASICRGWGCRQIALPRHPLRLRRPGCAQHHRPGPQWPGGRACRPDSSTAPAVHSSHRGSRSVPPGVRTPRTAGV